MKVLYHYEMRYPWPPGREDGDVVLDVEDLPPLIQRELRGGTPIEAMFVQFYHWEALGIDHWYWVRPAITTEARP